MAWTPNGLSYPPMDIRFWAGARTLCTVAHWNNDVAFEPWSKLYLALDGQARYAVARPSETPRWIDLEPGVLYLVPGGRRQLNACRSEYTLLWCHFLLQDAALAARVAALDSPRGFPGSSSRIDHALLTDCCTGSDALRLRASALVLSLLAQLPDPPTDAHAEDRRRLAPALERLTYGFARPQSVAELARLAGLRQSRFQEVFRRVHGTSVREYQISLRLAEARRLLRTTLLPVQVVAAQCGYANPFNFTRLFSQRLGCSPSHWRQTPE
jgi:AraC-like DNA-binding protein